MPPASAMQPETSPSPYAYLCGLASTLSKGIVELPSFPQAVVKVRTALQDPRISMRQVATLIRVEPVIAGRLLQLANSSAFNPTGRLVTDLDVALTRLGANHVSNLILAQAVRQLQDSASLRPISAKLKMIWHGSVTVAYFCNAIAQRTRLSPADAFVIGLLHGVGRLYILAQMLKPSTAGLTIDGEVMESWHPAIAKAVLENWGLDDSVCEAVGAQADIDGPDRGLPTLTDVLIASIQLADVLEHNTANSPYSGSSSFHRLALNSANCTALVADGAKYVALLRQSMGGG